MACDSRTTCTCTYPCSRHGKCCECVAYHRRSGKFRVLFSKAGEKTYDRSIENLYRDYKESRALTSLDYFIILACWGEMSQSAGR